MTEPMYYEAESVRVSENRDSKIDDHKIKWLSKKSPQDIEDPKTEDWVFGQSGVELSRDKVWECYLPAGAEWFDIWGKERYKGGQSVSIEAPIDRMPVFARAGAIIPMREGLTYAMEDNESPMELHIYTGADGEFTYYDDAGDDYAYEEGGYETVRINWSDAERRLVLYERNGGFHGMKKERNISVYLDDIEKTTLTYDGSMTEIVLS